MGIEPVSHDELRTKALTKEDEFFLRQEMDRAREIAKQKAAAASAAEKARLKKLHYMHCPKCGNELIEEDHRGVLIDRCPCCQGIWLDDGELEELASRLNKNTKKSVITSFLEMLH